MRGWEARPLRYWMSCAALALAGCTETRWTNRLIIHPAPATAHVVAKLASGICHVPGGANYTRTKADRCYLSAEAAEADGLRPSKN